MKIALGSAAALAIILVGCGLADPGGHEGVLLPSTAPATKFGAGVSVTTSSLPEITWTAWAYPASGDDLCMIFVWQDGRGDGGCTSRPGSDLTQDGETTFLIGYTLEPSATHARIVITGQDASIVDIIWTDLGRSTAGLYAASLDGVRLDDVARVDMLDGAGEVIVPEPSELPSVGPSGS